MNTMIQRIVIFLVRMKLGLKKGEHFRFVNQKSTTDYYYFTGTKLKKVLKLHGRMTVNSGVSLNWILDDRCEIQKLEVSE